MIQSVDVETLETSYTFRARSNESAFTLRWSNGQNTQTVDVGVSPSGNSGSWYLCKFNTPQRVSFKHKGQPFKLGFWGSSDGENWTFDSQKTLTPANADGVHITSGEAVYWAFGRYENSQDPSDPNEISNYGSYVLSSWYVETKTQDTTLTFPSSNGFDCFEPGDVVQGADDTLTLTYRYLTGTTNDMTTYGWSDGNNEQTALIGTAPGAVGLVDAHLIKLPKKAKISYYQGVVDAWFMMFASDTGVAGSWTRCAPCASLSHDPVFIEADTAANYFLVYRVDNASSGCQSKYQLQMNTDKYYGNIPSDPAVKVISKDEDANTITVDGGDWAGSDGSGTPGEQTTLVKETPYETKLTVDGSTDLADMTGSVLMTDGSTEASGAYTQTPYKLVTTEIESVEDIIYGDPTAPTSSSRSTYEFKDWLAGKGVTAITGLWLAKNSSNPNQSYTASFGDSKQDMDGIAIGSVPIKNFGVVISEIIGEPVSGVGSWTDWFAGTSRYAQSTASNFYAVKFVSPLNVENLSFVADYITYADDLAQAHPFGVYDQNGNTICLVGTWDVDSTTTLTFPGDVSTNPDLQYFLPGDVVQGNPLEAEITFDKPDSFTENGSTYTLNTGDSRGFDGCQRGNPGGAGANQTQYLVSPAPSTFDTSAIFAADFTGASDYVRQNLYQYMPGGGGGSS